MMDFSTAFKIAIGMKERGQTNAPNVEVVRMIGTKTVTGRLPREVRAELMDGVKSGRVGRLKKDGLKPEMFFHPNSRPVALELQRKAALASVALISGVMATPSNLRDDMNRNGIDLPALLKSLAQQALPRSGKDVT